MDLAQVVGLVQVRLWKRWPPQGPWVVLPLGHCTRVQETPEEQSCNESLASKSKGLTWSTRLRVRASSRESSPFSYRVKVELISCACCACNHCFCGRLTCVVIVLVPSLQKYRPRANIWKKSDDRLEIAFLSTTELDSYIDSNVSRHGLWWLY